MRPQRNAGENKPPDKDMLPISGRFNEAPAKCRGKPAAGRAWTTIAELGFNEAPAKCRGKPDNFGPLVRPLPWLQ